jgi:8-oxo-dGTP diphosphatase
MRKGVDFTGITTVFFCHDGKGHLLMNRRSQQCRDDQGRWDIGGGGLEFGFSPEENLMKEVREEYCTDVLEHHLLGTRSVNRTLPDGTLTHWIAFDYLALVDRDKVRNGEPNSIDEIAWFTLDSLPHPLHSQFPGFLERYAKSLETLFLKR